MVEARERSPLKPREFSISKKTSADFLISYNGHRRDGSLKSKVAADIIANFKELCSEINIEEVLESLTYDTLVGTKRGKAAISVHVAPPILSVATRMLWNLDGPEIVYMGGYRISSLLKEESEKAPSAEKSSTIKQLAGQIDEILEDFVYQKLPHGEAYLRVLKELSKPFGRRNINTSRLFAYLERGGHEDASLGLLRKNQEEISIFDKRRNTDFIGQSLIIFKDVERSLQEGKNIKEIAVGYGTTPEILKRRFKDIHTNLGVLIKKAKIS